MNPAGYGESLSDGGNNIRSSSRQRGDRGKRTTMATISSTGAIGRGHAGQVLQSPGRRHPVGIPLAHNSDAPRAPAARPSARPPVRLPHCAFAPPCANSLADLPHQHVEPEFLSISISLCVRPRLGPLRFAPRHAQPWLWWRAPPPASLPPQVRALNSLIDFPPEAAGAVSGAVF